MSLIGFKNTGGIREGSLQSVLFSIEKAGIKVTSCVVTEYTTLSSSKSSFASVAMIHCEGTEEALNKIKEDFSGQITVV